MTTRNDPTLAARYDTYAALLDRLTCIEGEIMAKLGIPHATIVAFAHEWEDEALPELLDALDAVKERARIADMRDMADWIVENATTDCDEDEPGAVKAYRIAADLRYSANKAEQDEGN